uniref:Uncharacterized protein n=1 Tax=Arundo donax TaxID=35708 RepID=A0A0A9H3P8_ARUDO
MQRVHKKEQLWKGQSMYQFLSSITPPPTELMNKQEEYS